MGDISRVQGSGSPYPIRDVQSEKKVLRSFVEGSTFKTIGMIPNIAQPRTISQADAKKLLEFLKEEMGHLPPHVEAEILAPGASELRKTLYSALLYQAPKAVHALCNESSALDPGIKALLNRLFYGLFSSRS